MRDLGRREDALASYTRALALAPGYAGALEMRGYLLHVLGRNEEASRDFADALRLAPELGFAQGMLLQSRMYNCDWRGYDEARQRLVDLVRAGKPGPEPFVFTVHSDNARDQLHCARTAVEARVPPSPTPVWRGERHAHDRIRVAYLSADFYDHATAYLVAELFERHDRSRFEVTGISWGPPRTEARSARGSGPRASISTTWQVESDRDVAQLLREREDRYRDRLEGIHPRGTPGDLRPARRHRCR